MYISLCLIIHIRFKINLSIRSIEDGVCTVEILSVGSGKKGSVTSLGGRVALFFLGVQ